METKLRNREEIDITNIKTEELEEISRKYPNGYIKKKEGKIVWVYLKDEETDDYAERLVKEA